MLHAGTAHWERGHLLNIHPEKQEYESQGGLRSDRIRREQREQRTNTIEEPEEGWAIRKKRQRGRFELSEGRGERLNVKRRKITNKEGGCLEAWYVRGSMLCKFDFEEQ